MNKYRNARHNGFASKKEANRASQLEVMQKLGLISELKQQVAYEILPKQVGERAAKYLADFQYIDAEGNVVTEDCKGMRTREYILKRKLMLFRFGIKILET